jgi:hypothetical protein
MRDGSFWAVMTTDLVVQTVEYQSNQQPEQRDPFCLAPFSLSWLQ